VCLEITLPTLEFPSAPCVRKDVSRNFWKIFLFLWQAATSKILTPQTASALLDDEATTSPVIVKEVVVFYLVR
jgi:hypothetical protein